MNTHGLFGPPDVRFWVTSPQFFGLFQAQTRWDVTVEGIMRRCLVCDHVRGYTPLDKLGQHLSRVTQKAYGEGFSLVQRGLGQAQGFIKIRSGNLTVFRGEPFVNSLRIHLHNNGHTAVHGYSQWLGTAHTAQTSR